MRDRISAKPGRILITPENGSPAFYATITLADEPTEQGTPLTKANLLSDLTKAKIGLTQDDPTIDDALFMLADNSGGSGLPTGGTTGQFLKKKSAADGDAMWDSVQQVPTGGVTNQVLTKTDSGYAWADASSSSNLWVNTITGFGYNATQFVVSVNNYDYNNDEWLIAICGTNITSDKTGTPNIPVGAVILEFKIPDAFKLGNLDRLLTDRQPPKLALVQLAYNTYTRIPLEVTINQSTNTVTLKCNELSVLEKDTLINLNTLLYVWKG